MSTQKKPIPLNTLDVFSTWLYGEKVAGATKRPYFRVQVIKNVPRFTVKTQVPNDKDYGRIDFPCDLATFSVIMNTINEFAEGRQKETVSFIYEDHKFINGQRSEKPLTISTLLIGRDSNTGKIYIAILGYNRPKIQFFFGPSQFYRLSYKDGSELKESDISNMYAKGFVKAYTPVVCSLLVSEFDSTAKNVPEPFTGNKDKGDGDDWESKPGKAESESRSVIDDFDEISF